jgi:hypothetical protein
MTPYELRALCEAALEKGKPLQITFPRGQPISQFWPNGRIVATTPKAVTYAFFPDQVIKMLRRSALDIRSDLSKL